MRTSTIERLGALGLALFGAVGLGAIVWDSVSAFYYSAGWDLIVSLHPVETIAFAVMLTIGIGCAAQSEGSKLGRLTGVLAILYGALLWKLNVFDFGLDLDPALMSDIAAAAVLLSLPFVGLWNLFGRKIAPLDLSLGLISLIGAAFTVPPVIYLVGSSMTMLATAVVVQVSLGVVFAANGVSLLIRGRPRRPLSKLVKAVR